MAFSGPLLKPSRLDRQVDKYEKRMAKAKAKKAEDRQAAVVFSENRRQAYKRDNGLCRVFGVGVKLTSANPLEVGHAHHVRFRSAGGDDSLGNLATVSARAHDLIHRHVLDVTGDANGTLSITQRHLETGRIVRQWDSPCPS